jgi:hypothetical protein
MEFLTSSLRADWVVQVPLQVLSLEGRGVRQLVGTHPRARLADSQGVRHHLQARHTCTHSNASRRCLATMKKTTMTTVVVAAVAVDAWTRGQRHPARGSLSMPSMRHGTHTTRNARSCRDSNRSTLLRLYTMHALSTGFCCYASKHA